MEVVASLSRGLRAAAQCGLFTYKSVPVIFEPPYIWFYYKDICYDARSHERETRDVKEAQPDDRVSKSQHFHEPCLNDFFPPMA